MFATAYLKQTNKQKTTNKKNTKQIPRNKLDVKETQKYQ